MSEFGRSFGQSNKEQSYGQIKKDQMARESELYSMMSGAGSGAEFGDLETFAAESDVRKNELLFKITTQIEDAKKALKQAEQLTERLRKRVAELEGMYRILTKK
ncbi:MAG: hypothetical protein FJ013_05480 [Chloroflexi bacterium]|nr:hypothetical protein [Chloroflexota bacterium]MBM4454014.1 hypothetical protein [Chloroflexota bacterium]